MKARRNNPCKKLRIASVRMKHTKYLMSIIIIITITIIFIREF